MNRKRVGLLLLILSLVVGPGGTAGNRPPIAEMQAVEAYRGHPVSFTLAARDPDGDVLRYSITEPPSDGTITGTPPELVYTPDPGFVGTDRVSYTVEDPFGAFDIGVVRFNVRESPLIIRWIVPNSRTLVERGEGPVAEETATLGALLAERGVQAWNIVRVTMGLFAQGTTVPVVLANQDGGTIEWVAVTQLGNGTVNLVSVPYRFGTDSGQQIVFMDTAELAPGVYLVTLGTGSTVYSIPFELLPLASAYEGQS